MNDPAVPERVRPAHHLTVVAADVAYLVGDGETHRTTDPTATAVLAYLASVGSAQTAALVSAVLDQVRDASVDDVHQAVRGLLDLGAVVADPGGDPGHDLPPAVLGLADALRARRGRSQRGQTSGETTRQARTGELPRQRESTGNPCGPVAAPQQQPGPRVGLVVVSAQRRIGDEAGDAGPAALREAFAVHGLPLDALPTSPTSQDPDPLDVTVVACTDLLDPRAFAALDAVHALGGAGLVIAFGANRTLLAPVLAAGGGGPCPECVRFHLRRAARPRSLRARAHLPTDAVHRAATATPLAQAVAANLAVALVVAWLVGAGVPAAHDVLEFDALAPAVHRHPVRRRPQCPSCGDATLTARRMSAPVRLRSRRVTLAAGYRSGGVSDFLDTVAPLLDPLTGLLDRQQETARCGPLHTVRGSHAVARDGDGWVHGVALGKGLSAAAARASLIGEAVERYSAAWLGDEPVLRATRAELGDDAIDPARVLLFSDAQLAGAPGVLTAPHDPPPQPLPPDLPVDWSPAWSLTHDRPRRLLTASVLFGHPETPFTRPDSNGCAAGASLEDAVLQGLLELIERDAVALWWYGRLRRPGVDDAGLGREAAALLARVRRALQGQGRGAWLLDLTSDLGVPVVAAISPGAFVEGGGQQICFGFGAHLDPDLAVARALGELAQVLAIGPGAALPEHRVRQPQAEQFWATATVAAHPYLAPIPAGRAAAATASPSAPRPSPVVAPAPLVPPTGDLAHDIEGLVARLAARGLEVVAADLTRPDVGVPVARVVVPGLRHFWPRLAPGRLYDVPYALGWVPEKLTEAGCNPVALFV